MKLPSFGKKEKQKYILALLLRDEKISALITEEIEGKMRIVGQHEEILTTPLEKLTEEEWLDTLDRTISKAEETLPPDRETHDTVFGVKESWVEDKKIKKEYLFQLKKISEALDLTPIGFLVISEAITHLIQAEEGAPVSAILVDIGKLSVTATLVRGGKILESKSVHREESLPADVDTALKHFRVEVFPSRVILFSGSSPVGEREDIEHLAQKFISHHWSKSLPFLHAPQISVLNGGFDAKAVVQGAASQMGFEVLNLTQSKDEEIKNYDSTEKPSGKKQHVAEEAETAEQEKVDVEQDTDAGAKTPMPDEDFGFIIDQDVSEQPKVVRDNFEEVATLPEKAHHEETHHTSHKEQVSSHHESSHAQEGNYADEESEQALAEELDEELGEKETSLSKLTGMMGSLTSFIPKNIALPAFLSGSGKKFLIIPLGILLILGVLYYLYVSNLKAEITIYLKPNVVNETAEVIFSSDSGNNFSENSIAAKTVSTEIEGSLSADATGKKDIGEKAKGTVTVYNNESAKKTIGSGTTIATDKGLKFTVDKDVSIASASGDIFSGTKPGTAQVAVTAAEFGSDYNLPSGTKFNVNGAANIAAKNDSAFSGGTKKQVTVVSKKDQDKLIADLSKSLQGKALEELSSKATGEQKLLKFLTQASVTDRTFDKKVDAEAKKVTLKGTVSFEALTYNQKDLEDYATVVLKDKYSDNLNLSEKGLTFLVKNEKQKDEGQVSATLTMEAGLIPKIDTASLTQKVEGKPLAEAEAELKKIPQVANTKISLSPSLPFIPVFLPKGDDRIKMTTALDE